MKTKTSILSVRVLVLCLTICQFHVSQALEVEEGIQMGHTQTPPVLKAKPSKAKSSAAKRLFYTRTKPTAVTKSVVTTTTVTKTTQNTQVTVAPIQKKAIAPVQQVATQSNTTAPAAPPVIKEDPGVTTPFESFDSTSSHRAGDWLTDDQSVLAPVPKGRMILATVSVSGSSVQSSASTVSTLGTKITVKQNGSSLCRLLSRSPITRGLIARMVPLYASQCQFARPARQRVCLAPLPVNRPLKTERQW